MNQFWMGIFAGFIVGCLAIHFMEEYHPIGQARYEFALQLSKNALVRGYWDARKGVDIDKSEEIWVKEFAQWEKSFR